MPFLPDIYSAPANDPQTFADDIGLEGQPPDINITIDCLDETKIENWWVAFKTSHRWETIYQNCSTTIADGLKAGGASEASTLLGNIALKWASFAVLVWTPNDVKEFAEAINKYKS